MKLLNILQGRWYSTLLPQPRVKRRKRQGLFLSLWFALVSSGVAPVSYAATDSAILFQDYQSITAQAYQEAVANNIYRVDPTASFDDFWRDLKQKRGADLVGLAFANMDLIEANLYEPQIRALVERLLDEGGYVVAKRIHALAKQSGDRYLVTKLNFDFARHHLQLGDHETCADFLNQTFISNALTAGEQDYAEIMRGILLQADSQHRESIKHYRNIKPSSPHYGTAQLNLATAYIRQDWWTDAHTAIDHAIEVSDDADYRDRLLTVLGYSQFQKELYRDARSTFRRVRTNGSYSRRALLGLGLAALHQGDYTGGLNAFRLLQQSEVMDKYKAESYLLTAVALEKLGQPGAASAAFNEAMAFYDGIIRNLQGALAKPASALLNDPEAANALILTRLDMSTVDADIEALTQLQQLPLSAHTRAQLDQTLAQYQERRQHLITDGLQQTLAMIEHYLNQSQFGIARLHDSAN